MTAEEWTPKSADEAAGFRQAYGTPARPVSPVDGRDAEIARLREELDTQRHMHEAFRPEVVAEIAVQLNEEADWEGIATWCGGTIKTSSDPSGEYTSWIVLPGGEHVPAGMWITLAHDGVFRARHTIDGPETAPSPVDEEGRRPDVRDLPEWRAFVAMVRSDGWPETRYGPSAEALIAAAETPTPPEGQGGRA